ncbi:hypothetical protein [Niabella sp.]|uniref:hypothetical protein n=1 Tax=Niabella sp. TaxID=1962976 RepID=UPI002635D98C|nr:hypothetical protein [Niabella sp.]
MNPKKVLLKIDMQVEREDPQTFEIGGTLESLPGKVKFFYKKLEAEFKYQRLCQPKKYYSQAIEKVQNGNNFSSARKNAKRLRHQI